MCYIRKTTAILLAMTLFIASLPLKSKEISLEYAQSLLEDDDWLTGIWSTEADFHSRLYSLFEYKNGQYKVTYCAPRYRVTWWTGKVKKQEKGLIAWNYEIQNAKLVLPKQPSSIYTLKNNNKSKMEVVHSEGWNDNLYLVVDQNELQEALCYSYENGKEYLEKQLYTIKSNKEKFEHFDSLYKSKQLNEFGNEIKVLNLIAQSSVNNEIYALLKLELTWPPKSGYCGAESENGYYWVNLKKVNNKYRIKDEWASILSSCRENTIPTLEENKEHIFLKFQDNGRGDSFPCFVIDKHDISQKPEACTSSKDMKNEN